MRNLFLPALKMWGWHLFSKERAMRMMNSGKKIQTHGWPLFWDLCAFMRKASHSEVESPELKVSLKDKFSTLHPHVDCVQYLITLVIGACWYQLSDTTLCWRNCKPFGIDNSHAWRIPHLQLYLYLFSPGLLINQVLANKSAKSILTIFRAIYFCGREIPLGAC